MPSNTATTCAVANNHAGIAVIARFWLRQHQSDSHVLRNNFLWTLIANVVYVGCQWGMFVVLAKLGDAVMVGKFSLGLAICAPVFLFCNLNLRGVQATDTNGEYTFSNYLSLRL